MATETTPNNQQSIRILVVDDHPNTAAMLARALTQLGPGVYVTSASNGNEALAKVKNSGVDILITDMIMPEMTGLELIEKLQNHPGGRPAYSYLITAYDVPGLKVTAHRLKVNEVIVKPVRPERICEIATQAIKEMHQTSRPPSAKTKSQKKFKILVADDKPDNVTLLGRYLEFEGYDILTANDGVDALTAIQDNLPDLVLLDVNMPNKDGFDVLEDVRANPATEHIPVIMLTAARLDPADVQSGLNLGADDYVTKPFDRYELMARIRTKLRVKEAEDGIRRRNRELSLLPEIGKELSARTDIKDIANIVLKRTAETMGALDGSILMMDALGTITDRHDLPKSSGDKKNFIDISGNLISQILDTRQGVVVKNTANDPDWMGNKSEPGQSAVIAPLFGRHELLGLLILTHEQEQYFNIENLLLLQAIASQAAIAIENTRLHFNVSHEHNLLDAILSNTGEGILVFDPAGRVYQANSAAQKLFKGGEIVVGERPNLAKSYEPFAKMLDRARATKAVFSGEMTWPDEQVFAISMTTLQDGEVVVVMQNTSLIEQ